MTQYFPGNILKDSMWEELTQYGDDRALKGEVELKTKERFYDKIGPNCIFNDMKQYNKKKTFDGVTRIQMRDSPNKFKSSYGD